MAEHQQVLRALSINLDSCIEATLGISLNELPSTFLDDRTRALVRLGALVALDAPEATTHSIVTAALAAGAGDDEIVGVLFAVAPMVGTPRIVSAASGVAAALGYDIERALYEGSADDPT
jgi:4-carboxymuconolactone decarboxylase